MKSYLDKYVQTLPQKGYVILCMRTLKFILFYLVKVKTALAIKFDYQESNWFGLIC